MYILHRHEVDLQRICWLPLGIRLFLFSASSKLFPGGFFRLAALQTNKSDPLGMSSCWCPQAWLFKKHHGSLKAEKEGRERNVNALWERCQRP